MSKEIDDMREELIRAISDGRVSLETIPDFEKDAAHAFIHRTISKFREKKRALKEEEVVAAPTGFPGILAENESWKQCPYDKSHLFLRDVKHLHPCREKYQKQRQDKGLPMDIAVCRYNWFHHLPCGPQLKEHEEFCEDQHLLFTYFQRYLERVRKLNKAKIEENEKLEALRSRGRGWKFNRK